jgi:hypothetical protein
MKTLMIVAGLMLTCFTMNAQDTAIKNTYPVWTISKDVQKIQFRNTENVAAIAVTGSNSMTVSKGVHTARQPESTVTGRVKKTGTPAWVVSKGVARMQMGK